MIWYEAEVRALERLAAPASAATLFYGGSSIRLWSTLSEDFPGCRIVNRGFGGATLAACVHYFDRLVVPVRPANIVLYAGDNDIGDGRSAAEVLRLFRTFRERVQSRLGPVPLTFVSIKPSPARWPLIKTIQEVNEAIRREPVNYIDIFHSMLDAGGMPDRRFFDPDGLHLSAEGYRLWVTIFRTQQNQIFTDCSHTVTESPLM
jgi:lysophospholipase L1-like esterase